MSRIYKVPTPIKFWFTGWGLYYEIREGYGSMAVFCQKECEVWLSQ